jgi:hypothetical protein
MKKILHLLLATLLFDTTAAAGRAETSEPVIRQASMDFLKAVVSDVLQNPDTAKYFPGLKVDEVALEPREKGDGWLISWSYVNAVHFVPNPDPSAQLAKVPAFDDKQGIVSSIFVSYKTGGNLVSRVKDYPVLKEPSVTAALYLKTGDNDAPLQKFDDIIKAHLPDFLKAVGAP